MKSFHFMKLLRMGAVLLLVLTGTRTIQAQDSNRKFGDINAKEWAYSKCESDPDAEAVVFFDSGESKFEDTEMGFDVIFTRYTRIKILKDKGTRWAEVEIPLYSSGSISESLLELDAVAYNADEYGTNATKLDPEQCKTEKINKYWIVKKFAIPNVKAGTIIEYKYKISSQRVFNLRDWEFQWKIPVVYSEYNVGMIPFYQYTYTIQGATQFDEYSTEEGSNERNFGSVKYKDLNHHFAMYHLPAFRDEEFISSINDYIIKLSFQLSRVNRPDGTKEEVITTWPAMKTDLVKDDNFGKYEQKCYKLAPKLFNIATLTTKSLQERYDTVINYLKNNLKWDGTNRLYCSKSPSKVLEDQGGSTAELNLMASGLLNAVGVTARPVIISTRSHGKVNTKYPFFDSFNSVVAVANIDSTLQLTDATVPGLDNNRLPANAINGVGLIIDKSGRVEWAILKNKYMSIERTVIKINPAPEKTTIALSVNANEYFNQKYRNDIGNDRTQLLKFLHKRNYEINDSSLKITEYDKKQFYRYKFEAEINTERINNKLYISPFAHELFTDNPLKQKVRSYPVDFIFSQAKMYTSEITIPQGYKVSYMPMGRDMDNDKLQLQVNMSQEGNTIRASLTYCFKKPEYEPKDYQALKDFFNEIIAKSSEKIVLEKL